MKQLVIIILITFTTFIATSPMFSNKKPCWVLLASSNKNTYDQELVEDIARTLKNHLHATSFDTDRYWFLIQGSKHRLERLMENKPWFAKENLLSDPVTTAD